MTSRLMLTSKALCWLAAIFLVAPSVANADEYATPLCKLPGGQCFVFNPPVPNSITPITVTARIYSGFPREARVANPAITVVGNLITVTGVFSHCTDCFDSSLPPPVSFPFTLPLLPSGTYTLELRLKPDANYQPPPVVDTGSGIVVAGVFMSTQFAVVTGSANAPETVIEYYDSALGHYFITPLANEIALLDAHQPPFQDWSRTGFSFVAYVNGTAPIGTAPICRFFNDSFNGTSSHFYAAQGLGCEATISNFPDWQLESPALFNTPLPAVTGACPSNTVPIYRLYNNGMGGAPNHRFLTDFTERQRMIGLGWIPEGYGVGVAMCAVG